jgi:hypothetical protein
MVTLDKGISYVSGLVSAVDETLSVNELKEDSGNDILYILLIFLKYWLNILKILVKSINEKY